MHRPDTDQVLIRTQGLTKIYGSGDAQVIALDNVDLQIRKNEFVAIMGPSGSGKSTLMNILGCLDRPSSGKYTFAGEDVSRLSKTERAILRNQRIGFIFQSYNLLPRTTALENVMLPLFYSHERQISETEQREKAIEVLNAVGLSDRIYHQPQELSGGQQQRVAIARALINDPLLILADEPTGNLDSQSGREIMGLLTQLHEQGRTIVMVTHDDHIAAYAQRIIHMLDGQIKRDILNGNGDSTEAKKEAGDAHV